MESIIYTYLCEKFKEKDMLAQYNDVPAVFNTKVPDDVDDNWNNGSQYPRCVFELKMQADPERKISGRLYVDVMCENETESVQPEELESIVKSAVDGCFFSNKELTISAQWDSSDTFSEKDNKLSGITLVFDIMAYPVQYTESPDPILSTNLWLKTIYQKAYVIGEDGLPATWKPTDTAPALYCRLVNLGEGRMPSTAAVTWIGANIRINVMAPSEHIRSRITRQIVQLLTNATRIMLDDGSPMLLDHITANMGADPLREGQITIKSTYGVLNDFSGTPLKHAYVSGINAEREVSNGN